MTRQTLRQVRPLLAAVLLAGSSAVSAQTFHYLNVAGSSFLPRDGNTTSKYEVAGCISLATGTNWFVYPLQLPEGSLIKYVRVYYNDTHATANLDVALTRYAGNSEFLDEAFFSTSGSNGFDSELSPQLNIVVDNQEFARQLLVRLGQSSSSLQFCGMRVAYYPDISADIIFRNGFDG